jgi:ADP-ribose pyrophosphatase YjhB (NUDIX family)
MKETKRYGGILVKCKNEVLLCKRNKFGSNLGSWSIPAGKLNKNELPFLGAKREFFEETNIVSLEKIKLCGVINRKTKDNLKNKGLMYVYLMEVDEKIYPDLTKAKDGNEHSECAYFTLKNSPIEDKNDQLYILIKNILSKT